MFTRRRSETIARSNMDLSHSNLAGTFVGSANAAQQRFMELTNQPFRKGVALGNQSLPKVQSPLVVVNFFPAVERVRAGVWIARVLLICEQFCWRRVRTFQTRRSERFAFSQRAR